MKKALILLLILCLAGCGAVQESAPAAVAAPVTEIVPAAEEAIEAEEGPRTERNDFYDENGVFCGYDICEYDELDRITLEEQFDADGNCTGRWVRSYSEDGRECVTQIYSGDVLNSKLVSFSDERDITREQWLYDDRDALLSVSYYDEAGELSRTENYYGEPGAEQKYSELSYGENGSLEERIFAPDGSVESVWNRWFDENAHEIRSLCYEGGAFRWDHRSTYDERGFCVRMEYRDESEALQSYTLMDYTPEGLCCLQEDYDAGDVMQKREVMEYRADGQLLSLHRYDGAGELTEYSLLEYDEMDRVQKRETYSPEDELLHHMTYKYAEDGSYEVRAFDVDNVLLYRESYDAEGYFLERKDYT